MGCGGVEGGPDGVLVGGPTGTDDRGPTGVDDGGPGFVGALPCWPAWHCPALATAQTAGPWPGPGGVAWATELTVLPCPPVVLGDPGSVDSGGSGSGGSVGRVSLGSVPGPAGRLVGGPLPGLPGSVTEATGGSDDGGP